MHFFSNSPSPSDFHPSICLLTVFYQCLSFRLSTNFLLRLFVNRLFITEQSVSTSVHTPLYSLSICISEWLSPFSICLSSNTFLNPYVSMCDWPLLLIQSPESKKSVCLSVWSCKCQHTVCLLDLCLLIPIPPSCTSHPIAGYQDQHSNWSWKKEKKNMVH